MTDFKHLCYTLRYIKYLMLRSTVLSEWLSLTTKCSFRKAENHQLMTQKDKKPIIWMLSSQYCVKGVEHYLWNGGGKYELLEEFIWRWRAIQ